MCDYGEKQRIDKWLWHARFFRTRTLAAKTIEGGHCRVNRQRISKSGHGVRAGDVLTFTQGNDVRVIEIVDLAEKRGSAPIAQKLYTDLDPPKRKARTDLSTDPVRAPVPTREKGDGRPTKKDRRAFDKMTETV